MTSKQPRILYTLMLLLSSGFIGQHLLSRAFVTTTPCSRKNSSISRFSVIRKDPPRSSGFNFIYNINTDRIVLSSTGGSEESSEPAASRLPFWLDPGTRGGAVVLSLILFILPLIAYSVATGIFGFDEVEAGKWIGVGFTAAATFLWVFTYIFRVATKDMTYAKQLKDYENAVIQKRLEELDDDEVQALVEEIERDEF